jgi:hypothetical protein
MIVGKGVDPAVVHPTKKGHPLSGNAPFTVLVTKTVASVDSRRGAPLPDRGHPKQRDDQQQHRQQQAG